MSESLCVGDRVRYTREGQKATEAPPGVVGVVEEVEEYAITVRWPMGLSEEYPDHVRRAGR